MSESPTNRRKKRTFEPIDLDELYNAPNLRGMCSFLERSPEEAQALAQQRKVVDQLSPNPLSPLSALPSPATETLIVIENTTPSDIATQISLSPSDIPMNRTSPSPGEMSAANISLPPAILHSTPPGVLHSATPGNMPDSFVSAGGRILKIHRCTHAQQGHSTGEQTVYEVLWERGTAETEDSRLVTIGLGKLSKLTAMDITNVRKNVRALIRKLSLELMAAEISGEQRGKTYRVFSDRQILENRQKVGMEWILKSKGVVFIESHEA